MNSRSTSSSKRNTTLVRQNLRLAQGKWGNALGLVAKRALRAYSEQLRVSLETGNLLLIDGKWYVTHSGLLRLATRKRCRGIEVSVVPQLCDPSSCRWAFKATVYESSTCKGFVGHGDADIRCTQPTAGGAVVAAKAVLVTDCPDQRSKISYAVFLAYWSGFCSNFCLQLDEQK
jgi:hypothetical protein